MPPERIALLEGIIECLAGDSAASALFWAERLFCEAPDSETGIYHLAECLRAANRPLASMWLLRQHVHVPGRTESASHEPSPAKLASLRCARLYTRVCAEAQLLEDARASLETYFRESASPQRAPHTEPEALAYVQSASRWAISLDQARVLEKDSPAAAARHYLDAFQLNPLCFEALQGACTLGAAADVIIDIETWESSPLLRRIRSQLARLPDTSLSVPRTRKRHHQDPPEFEPAASRRIGPRTPSGASASDVSVVEHSSFASEKSPPSSSIFENTGTSAFAPPAHVFPQDLSENSISHSNVPGTHENGAATASPDVPPFPGIPFPEHPESLIATPFGISPSQAPHAQHDPPPDAHPAPTASLIPRLPHVQSSTPQIIQDAFVHSTPSLPPEEMHPPDANSSHHAFPHTFDDGHPALDSILDDRVPMLFAEPSDRPYAADDSLAPLAMQFAAANEHPKTPAPSKRTTSVHFATLSVFGNDDDDDSANAASTPLRSAKRPLNTPRVDPSSMDDAVRDLLAIYASYVSSLRSRGLSRHADAISAIINMDPIHRRCTLACLIMAHSYADLVHFDLSCDAFERARRHDPFLTQGMDIYSTVLWHRQDTSFLQRLVRDLLSYAPHAAQTWVALGNLYSLGNQHLVATKAFRRAITIDPSYAYAYTLCGHECVVLEEYDNAFTYYRHALRIDPHHYNAWHGLGNVYLMTGRLRFAEFHFRRALENNPSNAFLLSAVAQCLEKRALPLHALPVYDKALTIAPSATAVRIKRASLLLSLRRYSLAESDLLLLRTSAPHEFIVHFLLGKLYLLTGRAKKASRAFTLAQNANPRAAPLIREQYDSLKT